MEVMRGSVGEDVMGFEKGRREEREVRMVCPLGLVVRRMWRG